MSKQVRLEDNVYQRLDALRGKRESFSQCVERLISIIEPIRQASEMLNKDRISYKVLHGEEITR